MITDSSLLTPPIIGNEFALLLHNALGGPNIPHVECERVRRDDAFGPIDVIEVRWEGKVAHLRPARETLKLALDDYSRVFIQPIVEEWLAQRNMLVAGA